MLGGGTAKPRQRPLPFNPFPIVLRFTFLLRFLSLLLLGGLALEWSGCSGSERLSYATEVDEPAYREGQALLKSGRWQEALNAFLKVIDRRGEDAAESHLELGLLYLQHINDPLSAIYHFRKYLALRPNSPQAALIKQRIDAATREFARTLPAQPLENKLQRIDLVAALDRLKQENGALKQDLADLKANRSEAAQTPAAETDHAITPAASGNFNFSAENTPVVRTRPLPSTGPRPKAVAPKTNSTPVSRPNAQAKPALAAPVNQPAGVRQHTVKAGDTLFKLAQQYYGSRAKWRDIFSANRNVMKSESDLKAGMVLRSP